MQRVVVKHVADSQSQLKVLAACGWQQEERRRRIRLVRRKGGSCGFDCREHLQQFGEAQQVHDSVHLLWHIGQADIAAQLAGIKRLLLEDA